MAFLLALFAITNFPTFAAQTNSDRIVVMISVDGLAGYYLDDPKAEMPNIRALAAEGVRATAMKATTPTVTWPNHTTLVTGVAPAKHGVLGNNYFDRASGQRVTLISDPDFDKDQIVKTPTIYDVAKANGLKTASIRWPATRNARSLDWTMPDVGTEALLKRYSTPSLVAECERAGLPLEKASKDKAGKSNHGDALDETYTAIFNLILRTHRPQLALLHIINVDHTQHLRGPNTAEAYEAIKVADQHVGEVWAELKKNFPGQATLLIVSDHGFSPINRIILPNVILKTSGINGSESSKKNDVYVVPQGGAAFIYLRSKSHRDETLQKIRQAFANIEGVQKVVGVDQFKDYGVADPKADPHAPDLILFAGLGYAFGDTAAGVLPFEDKPERRGTHGHDPNIPELKATFVAWGNGIKPGAQLGEISNLDVAPTIARLLDVKFPTDGVVLTNILTR